VAALEVSAIAMVAYVMGPGYDEGRKNVVSEIVEVVEVVKYAQGYSRIYAVRRKVVKAAETRWGRARTTYKKR
jgi:hypothetical protein